MKNLKLILGLVVVMMTTTIVKGQEYTVSLTLEDFEWTGYIDDGFEAGQEVVLQDNYILLYGLQTSNVTFTIKSKAAYSTDTIRTDFQFYVFTSDGDYYYDEFPIYNSLEFDNDGYLIITIEFNFYINNGMVHMGMETADLVYDKPLNIFEHEQTNTTVTSYNKELTIKSSEYQNVDVQIYNMGGQMVNTLTNIELGYADTKINMYDNPNGVYFILVKDNYTGKVEKHKVMLQ